MGRHAQAQQAFLAAMREDPSAVETGSGLLFSLNFRSDLSPESVFREHARIGALIEKAAGPPYTSWNVPWIAERRLRVGYVSGDFIQHPVARFLAPVLARHDRSAFDIHCFSNNADADDITRQLRRYAAHWHVVAGDDDAAVARRIHALGIDILVDLSGHTTRHRLGVFARRPAPVQATWLGYLNTTGLSTIDYRICDRHTDPEGETEHLHTERLVRLAHSQWCYLPFDDLPRAAPSEDAAREEVVFGSFNQIVKVSDATLDLWGRILRELPRATLAVMDTHEGWSRASLLARLDVRGVSARARTPSAARGCVGLLREGREGGYRARHVSIQWRDHHVRHTLDGYADRRAPGRSGYCARRIQHPVGTWHRYSDRAVGG